MDLSNIGVSEDEYKLPELENAEVDIINKQINIVKENPYDKMVKLYKDRKIDLLPPGKNCKKKGCYGRGYIGMNGNTPIACDCVLPKAFKDEHKGLVALNYKLKRRMLNNSKNLKQSTISDISKVPNMDLSSL
jgi:hypothetical protein